MCGKAALVLNLSHHIHCRLLAQLVGTQYFQWVMMCFIIASSTSLAFTTVDLEPEDERYKILWVLDIVFTAVFCMEVRGSTLHGG